MLIDTTILTLLKWRLEGMDPNLVDAVEWQYRIWQAKDRIQRDEVLQTQIDANNKRRVDHLCRRLP